MNDSLEEYQFKTFENIKHIDEYGNEYWTARELQIALDYTQWRNFELVINKAKKACSNSNYLVYDHFADISIMVRTGDSKRLINDYNLSRYACYLIVQNSNPNKEIIAMGQTYFAIQTRKQEITEEYFNTLNENKKRLITRGQTIAKNKTLYKAAKDSGVDNYGKFTNYGIKVYMAEKMQNKLLKEKGLLIRMKF